MTEPDEPGRVLVERSVGSAHEFHHRALDWSGGDGAVWIHEVTQPAIVLGSAQREDVVDRVEAERAGYEVSGRRSGGGLVVVEPAQSCWIDVLIRRTHPRWDDDVNRAFDWIGEWWRAALTSLDVAGLAVHRGDLVARDHGRLVCFAGLGPGEVVQTVPGSDPAIVRKVVGLSQRRTRDVARFQGLYLRRWNPEPLRSFVRPGVLPDELDLDEVSAGLVDGPAPADVIAAFLDLV